MASGTIACKEITSFGDVTVSTTPTRCDTFRWYKNGNVVQVKIDNVQYSDTSIVILGHLPSGYAPSATVYFLGIDVSGNVIKFFIDTSGNIRVVENTGKLLYGSVTFIIG